MSKSEKAQARRGKRKAENQGTVKKLEQTVQKLRARKRKEDKIINEWKKAESVRITPSYFFLYCVF